MTLPPPGYIDSEVIRLTREGVWLSGDQEITHEATLHAFTQNIRRDDQGYYLQIGRDTKRIVVDDTPYFIQGLEGEPKGGFKVRVSDGSLQELDPGSLRYQPGRLVCDIRTRSGQTLEARFLRAAYSELMSHLEEDDDSYFLTIGSRKLNLAKK